MNKIMCCFIGHNKQECKKEAEFVFYGNTPDDHHDPCSNCDGLGYIE